MKRSAFSMLELVFVIVVLAIISVFAIPDLDRSLRQEMGEQIAADIRYTQHLAMTDDKFNETNATWWRERWQIRFRRLTGEIGYVVFSDRNQNRNSNQTNPQEIARDPQTGEFMNGFLNYRRANLTATYNINNFQITCFNNDGSLVAANLGVIAFDSLGRPYGGVSNGATSETFLLNQPCTISLSHPKEGDTNITIQPVTGYVSITYP